MAESKDGQNICGGGGQNPHLSPARSNPNSPVTNATSHVTTTSSPVWAGSGVVDEQQINDPTDDFDPFSVVEYVENLDIALDAPPESEWYHGRLDRVVAEERMRNAGLRGGYLIRESDRKPGSYVLTFNGKTGVHHFRITAICGDYYVGGREFDSLSDLIGYYTKWSDLLKGERLQHPVAPPEPVNDKKKVISLFTYSQMPETDELSFSPGELFEVHNDMGDGWLWVKSQSTGQSGIVNKEFVHEIISNDPAESFHWFHGSIDKQQARSLLADAGPGSWLVRPSDTTDGDYTLFFYCNKCIERFKIQRSSGDQYFMGGRYYTSVLEIIERYQKEQIVEGYVLGNPVLRAVGPRGEGQNTVQNNGSKESIYSTMRQSNGSNFFLNRKDRILMKGFLSKKSQKTKKWKSMFFVLNGTDQILYYFDNEKRTKPRNLIDLNYSSLYPVHDSLFGRPNCIQLILNALNQVSAYYLCADNSDLCQQWIQALKPCCTNTQPKKPKKPSKESTLPSLTELRSLLVKIYNAKFTVKTVPHPYCIVSLNEVKVCRTQVKESLEPCWDEDFMLDDIPQDIDTCSISIYNKESKVSMSKDKELLTVKVALKDIQASGLVDEWYTMTPVNAKASEVCSIRIGMRYLHEVIMPIKEYSSLKELLLNKELETVLALASVCHETDRVPLATALLQIFRYDRQEALLLTTLTGLDIKNEGNTLATTLMDQYMKMTSTALLRSAVQVTIQKILDSKQSCETNPTLLDNPSDCDTNSRQLISVLNEVLNTIISAIDSYPMSLRYVCNDLQKRVTQKWPNDAYVRTRVVSCFIFLRLVCPAIVNPKQFNLITEIPSPMAARTLKIVASSLVKLANLVEARETHMEVINPFIRDNIPKIIQFLDDVSNVQELPQAPVSRGSVSSTAGDMSDLETAKVDISRSLATIHQICVSHLDELHAVANSQPYIKKLVTIVEMLTDHKNRYMEVS